MRLPGIPPFIPPPDRLLPRLRPSGDNGKYYPGCLAYGVAYIFAIVATGVVLSNFDFPEWLSVILGLLAFLMMVAVLTALPKWLIGIIASCFAGVVMFLLVRGGVSSIANLNDTLLDIIALICGLFIAALVFFDAMSAKPPSQPTSS